MNYRYELVADDGGPLSSPCRLARSSRSGLLRAARKELRERQLFGRWRVVRVGLEDGQEMYRSFAGWFDADGIFRVYLSPSQTRRRDERQRKQERMAVREARRRGIVNRNTTTRNA